MAYYKSFREYIQTLEANDRLVRVKKEINKDTELMPLVKWEFRGLPEKQRKGFLFENVTDVKGKKYDGSVAVGVHGASRDIYAMAMMCKPAEVKEKWIRAGLHPLAPKVAPGGPVQEEVHIGESLLKHGGLQEFPIPISTPGFDNAPYLSAPCWFSKDPETGIGNIGTYRGMIKGKALLGCNAVSPKHLGMHWEKYRAKGIPMPVAVVLGATPNIGLVSVAKLSYGVDECAVAGAIAGEPVEVVKCQTSDLVVPATAEIVIEGTIPIDFLEREGPFGEYTGYIGMDKPSFLVNVTCITHRKTPIYSAFTSQFPPSESSILRSAGYEFGFYKFLRYDMSLTCLLDLAMHDDSGGSQFCVLSLKQGTNPIQVWKALHGAAAYDPIFAKIIVAVDDDIDPRDIDSVIWAMTYRMQPHRDIQIAGGMAAALDPSSCSPEDRKGVEHPRTSTMMMDATRKWDYPPLSLPRKEYMERAREIWDELGLPPLTPKVPWYGYSLGYWTKQNEEEADLAVKGESEQTGERLAKERKYL